ncbi:MAG: hypothetical protein NXI08_09845 [bacterium]|nr:hypothetical protein [bacterium]
MMKNLLLVCIGLVLLSVSVHAQETYRTTMSDPEIAYPGYLGLNYFTVDAGFSNTSGASIWSVGVDGLYPINEKLRVEAQALYSLLSLQKDGPAFLFSAGAEYGISSKTKDKEVPVLLSFAWEKDYFNNTETQTWEAVKLPAQMKYELVARGGLYVRNSALEYEEGFTFYDVTSLTHAGVYAGVGYTMTSYLQAQASDGYEFAAGRVIRPYADVLILPTTVDLELNGVAAKTIEETLGWRAGVVVVGKPFTKAENYDRKIRFFANSIFRLDIGSRPFDGFYVTTGMAWNFKKFK